MKIEQTHTGDTKVVVLHDQYGSAYLRLDDLILVLKAWADANKEQPALMGLTKEIIILRNRHQTKRSS